MRSLTSCCVALFVGCCAFAASACESPSVVAIPDGKSSTMDQLLAAQGQHRLQHPQGGDPGITRNDAVETGGHHRRPSY